MEKEDVNHYRRVRPDLYRLLTPPVTRFLDTKVDRETHNPENILIGPAVYVANHIRFEDSIVLPATVMEETDQVLRMAAKIEYFEGKGLDGKYGRTLKFFMEHTQMLPVDREGGDPRAFQKLQAVAQHHLNRDEPIGFHAEGTRVDDGKMYKFKSGAARIAIASAVPLVPAGFVYTSYSNGQKLHVDTYFGEPIMPEEYIAASLKQRNNQKLAEHFTQVIEGRVAEMTGMKQAGVFAELRKNRLKE